MIPVRRTSATSAKTQPSTVLRETPVSLISDHATSEAAISSHAPSIHLWVEGAWELIAASLVAWSLIKLTGVSRKTVEGWVFAEVALVLLTGIIGTGHHYYWIGTPHY